MQLLFAIPDKRLCSGIGQNKVHDRDLKEAHQERLTHIPRRKGHPVGLEPTTPCPASRANNPTDSATLRQLGRPSGCCLSIYEVIGQIQKKETKRRARPLAVPFFLCLPNNFEPLIPMRNLIFLSHSFLIESDIRTFSAFQDQSSAVLSMCINRLKVTSCGFQFLSQHLYIFFLFTYDRRASKRKLIVITFEYVFGNQDITRIFNRRKHFCHSCIENVLIVN